MKAYTVFPLGDQAVTLSLGDTLEERHHIRLMAMKSWLEKRSHPWILDIVVAYTTLTVQYDLYLLVRDHSVENAFEYVKELLESCYRSAGVLEQRKGKIKQIPVCYDDTFAPDIGAVCSITGMSRDEIRALHTGRTYSVYLIGFLPGFAYMASVDERLRVLRKEKPAPRIEAGSVGLAGVQTGIYPVVSPGGWQIIGRTPQVLFDKTKTPPVFLEPGDRVQFLPVTTEEFHQLKDAG